MDNFMLTRNEIEFRKRTNRAHRQRSFATPLRLSRRALVLPSWCLLRSPSRIFVSVFRGTPGDVLCSRPENVWATDTFGETFFFRPHTVDPHRSLCTASARFATVRMEWERQGSVVERSIGAPVKGNQNSSVHCRYACVWALGLGPSPPVQHPLTLFELPCHPFRLLSNRSKKSCSRVTNLPRKPRIVYEKLETTTWLGKWKYPRFTLAPSKNKHRNELASISAVLHECSELAIRDNLSHQLRKYTESTSRRYTLRYQLHGYREPTRRKVVFVRPSMWMKKI